MTRSAVFALLSVLVLVTACKNENETDWTPERRKWVHSLCEKNGNPSKHCDCIVREIVSTVTYKEFAVGRMYEDAWRAANGVCSLSPGN